jgi:membrane protein implicated in regulation of membrane protease activity
MAWWGWVAAGALLLTAELGFVDADFFLVFLGASALAVGALGLAGLAGPVWLQWLLFAALALISLVLFRQKVYERFHPAAPDLPDNVERDLAVTLAELPPHGRGPIELRGSRWTGQNDGDAVLAAGARVRVVRADGVVVHVRPLGDEEM